MKKLLLITALVAASLPISAQAQVDGMRGYVLATLDDARTKIVALTEAMPVERLTWRPGEGVRSISEVVGHIAGANYMFASMIGTSTPEGIDPMSMEGIADRDELVRTLQASFDHVQAALENLTDEQLNTSVQWFDGSDKSYGFVVHFLPVHAREHLGQLIAYARTNEVVPPWSQQ